jgi:O-antigen ligase
VTAQRWTAGTGPRAGQPAGVETSALSRIGRSLLFAIPVVWCAAFVVGYVTALWLLTGTGLALTIAGLRRPSLGLLGVSMLACLDAPSRVYLFTGGILRWNTVAYLLLLVAVVYFRDMHLVWGLQVGLLAFFTLLLVGELLLSPDRASGMQHVLGLSAVFGMLGFCIRGGVNPENWLWTARVTGVLAAAGGLVYFLLRDDLPYMNPNALAYLHVTALLLAVVASTVMPSRERRGLLLPLCVAANLAWIFLSGSRGSLLVGMIGTGFFVLNWRGRSGARAAIGVALVAAILGTGLFSDLQSGMKERLGKLFQGDRSLSNRTSGRSDIAIVGWRMFRDNPMGVGTGGFMVVASRYGRVANLDVFRGHEELQAHSVWIKTLGESGVPGVLLLAGFIASFTVVGWRRRAQGVAELGLAVSLILSIAFLSTEFQAKGLWLFTAAGLVVVRLWKRSIRSSRPSRAPAAAGRAVA